jgi:IgGFc binding protein
MKFSFAFRGATLMALAMGGVACGGGQGPIGFNNDGGTDGPGGDGSITDGRSRADVPNLLGDSGGKDGTGSALQCSSDLQSVVSSSGVLVMKCPPDEGCAGGKCVAACDAAAAAKGTIGCDFVVATPSFFPEIAPPCFAIFIANNWGKAVTIEVTRGGMSYDPTSFGLIPTAGTPASSWTPIAASGVPQGDVGILFMSQDPSSENGTPLTCPITPAVNTTGGTAIFTDTASASGLGSAWHIVTDVPVTAYDILPYGGASSYLPSAELLIPTTAWTTNYYGIVPYRGNASADQGPQWGQIVASQDGTVVKVVPNVTLPAGTGVASAPSGALTTYSLNAGDYLQWQDSTEMSGTVISSNYPVGFSGGLGYDCYSSVTSTGGGCDSAHQQIPPISALGFDYVVPPFTTRRASLAPESIPYRIVGAVDGTNLTYDPPGLTSTTGTAFSQPPTTLSAGQVVEFETAVAFRVTSQDANHPFYVGQVMPGCMVTDGSRPGCDPTNIDVMELGCCLGDEEFVNILPPAQYLEKYIFFTDVTYATTNLVFTRTKTAGGFQDVSLDCAGTLTGWQPVGTGGIYEITNIDLIRATTPNGSCNNGPHTATSTGPFGLMVWGLDEYSSYAYPAGGNVAPINTVIITPTPK